MLKLRDKQAFPNAPEWAKRMKIKKRPLQLAVKSLVIFARTFSVEWWGQK